MRNCSVPRMMCTWTPAEHQELEADVKSPLLQLCNLLRPVINILFLLVLYGYITIKIKRSPKEMTELSRESRPPGGPSREGTTSRRRCWTPARTIL